MSTAQTLALGAVAGFTIFLGLPLGRVRSTDVRLQAGLSALACGVLLFLLWDVLVHGVEPVEEALEGAVEGEGSWARVHRLRGAPRRRPHRGSHEPRLLRPLDEAAAQLDARRARAPRRSTSSPRGRGSTVFPPDASSRSSSRSVSACTTSARDSPSARRARRARSASRSHSSSASACTTRRRASASSAPCPARASGRAGRFLGLLGLIGGGPTFLGTDRRERLGERGDLDRVLRRRRRLDPLRRPGAHARQPQVRLPVLVTWMLLLGLFLGFATDFVLEAAEHAS